MADVFHYTIVTEWRNRVQNAAERFSNDQSKIRMEEREWKKLEPQNRYRIKFGETVIWSAIKFV